MTDTLRFEPIAQRVLTVEQTAAVLKVSGDTIRNLHRTGQLPGRLIGRHLRWLVQDIDQYLERFTADRTP